MDQHWTDLPHSFGLSVQDMAHITNALESYVDVECKGDCLHLLAMFLSDVAPTWRSQVFMLSLVSVIANLWHAVHCCTMWCCAVLYYAVPCAMLCHVLCRVLCCAMCYGVLCGMLCHVLYCVGCVVLCCAMCCTVWCRAVLESF